MPYIQVNGFDMYYQTGGVGEPVVYVHGGFASLDTKLRAADLYEWTWESDFARYFQFICYDRRGCWHSSSPKDGYELTNQAADLEGLLDLLNIKSAHIIGSSAGGPISIIFAATRPNRVRSLVLVGTGLKLFPVGDPSSDLLRQQIQLMDQEGPEAAFEQRPEGVDTSLEVLWELEEEKARGTLSEYLARKEALTSIASQLARAECIHYYHIELISMKAYLKVDVRSYAQQVAVPTLIIQGSNDKVVPVEWAKELMQVIPSAQYHLVKGGSHGLMFRNAEARHTAIDFIKQCSLLFS